MNDEAAHAALEKFFLANPPKIVPAIDNSDDETFLICSTKLHEHAGSQISNCSECGRPVCFREKNVLVKKLCAVCAATKLQTNPKGATVEHLMTLDSLSTLSDWIYNERRKN